MTRRTLRYSSIALTFATIFLACVESQAQWTSTQTFSGGYLKTEGIHEEMLNMTNSHPANISVTIVDYGDSSAKRARPGGISQIGYTTFGFDLEALKIVNPNTPGPNSSVANKPRLMLVGGAHADEFATPEVVLMFAQWLLANYITEAQVHWLLDEHEFWIVPTMNPDGRDLSAKGLVRRENASLSCSGGVDLNRNFPFKWGLPGSSPTCGASGFRGTVAASEWETHDLMQLVNNRFPIDFRGPLDTDAALTSAEGFFIQVHAALGATAYPWGFTSTAAPNSVDLQKITAVMGGLSGLKSGQVRALKAVSGTIDDWVYGEIGIPAVLMELFDPDRSGPINGLRPPFAEVSKRLFPSALRDFVYAASIAKSPYITGRGPALSGLQVRILAGTPNQVEITASVDTTKTSNVNMQSVDVYVGRHPYYQTTPNFTMNAVNGTFNAKQELAFLTIPITGFTAKTLVYLQATDINGNKGAVSAIYVDPVKPAAKPELIIDNAATTNVSVPTVWTITPAAFPYNPSTSTNVAQIDRGATGNFFRLNIPTLPSTPGNYKVYEWHSANVYANPAAPHTINFGTGSQTINVDQRINAGQWNSLGTFNFNGVSNYVAITSNPGAVSTNTIADAIRIVKE
jgi:Zinc carboxypeptidase